ncbi:hypothetical protein DL765_005011 [Monosporascus sp. GIB2]|nr:hypothetical protein DL765_005011 [Monosporascus sp. GIB2]
MMINLTTETAYSAFVDLYLAIYPAIVLFGLQLSIKKKLALSASLGLGAVGSACITAIYKTTRIPSLASSKDPTYETADLTVWTCVEGSTIISAACIPVLRPLADKLLGRQVFSSMSKGQGYQMQSSERSGGPPVEVRIGLQPTKARKHPHHLDTLAQTAQNESQETIARWANDNQQNGIVCTHSIEVLYSDGDKDMSSSGYSWK